MVNRWVGDLLGRHELGDYLTKLVEQRISAPNGGSPGAFCFAIDGDWGTGKSFFVNHWSRDLEDQQHPVVRFDAWVNDLADDPLVGFMAALDSALDGLRAKVPGARRARVAAAAKLKEFRRNAPRAILPVMGVVAKGLARTYLGADTAEIAEAVMPKEGQKAAGETAEKALDQFFKATLGSHQAKQQAIASLKSSIEAMLSYLYDQRAIRLPVFVMVDELDRCRPDYAIRLLEGVKHLFDARGLCFVFSTNLSQLKESARAVYGPGFDGYGYLKRFFAFEYRLPAPSTQDFQRKLVESSSLVSGRLRVQVCVAGTAATPDEVVAREFALIARAFELDLRSQQQVFRIAEYATAGLNDGVSLFAVYLFLLAAAYHSGPDVYSNCRLGSDLGSLVGRLSSIDISFKRAEDGRLVEAETTLFEVLRVLHSAANMNGRQYGDLFHGPQLMYPKSLLELAAQEFSGRGVPRETRPSSMSRYFDLIRYAGQTFRAA